MRRKLTPVGGNTFFTCGDIELDMQACSCLHTCTDCVNSNTVVGSFTQNADESHHYNKSLLEVCCCLCLEVHVHVCHKIQRSPITQRFSLEAD